MWLCVSLLQHAFYCGKEFIHLIHFHNTFPRGKGKNTSFNSKACRRHVDTHAEKTLCPHFSIFFSFFKKAMCLSYSINDNLSLSGTLKPISLTVGTLIHHSPVIPTIVNLIPWSLSPSLLTSALLKFAQPFFEVCRKGYYRCTCEYVQ